MEGYDNMDNNLNSNGSGIPNVNDIKFEDTPAQSFDNLYGGVNQSPNNNVADGVGMMSNPSMMSNMSQANVNSQSVATNSNVFNQSSVQPVNNVGVQVQPSVESQVVHSNVSAVNTNGFNSVNGQTNIMPNAYASNSVNNNIGMTPNPQVMSNPGISNPTPVQPANNVGIQSHPGFESQSNINGFVNQTVANPVNVGSINNGVGAQVNPGIAQNMNQGSMITPNPVNVNSNGIGLSNVDIDAERMQSIEEQLSKTSQYNPEDLQQEKITIPTDNQYEKNKSGLAFVIVLFVILAVVIAFLPQITKLIK